MTMWVTVGYEMTCSEGHIFIYRAGIWPPRWIQHCDLDVGCVANEILESTGRDLAVEHGNRRRWQGMESPELRFGPSVTLSVGPWERPALQGLRLHL